MPGAAAGTERNRHWTVLAATSSTPAWVGQSNPDSTMLGLRIVPSSATP